jgi:hypothetical protein
MQNLSFGPECTISGNRSCEASSLLHWNQNNVWERLGAFTNLRHVKRCKTCVSGLKEQFQGIEVLKHPFYPIVPKMMFRSVLKHFANLGHLERCKTCVSGLNALFRHTKVVKHPFYSIGTKMRFESVSEHFEGPIRRTREGE